MPNKTQNYQFKLETAPQHPSQAPTANAEGRASCDASAHAESSSMSGSLAWAAAIFHAGSLGT